MSALKKLVHRCNEMDITEQINWLGDAIMPSQAAEELAALEAERRFLDSVVLGDGDHDKVVLVKNASVFLECFKLLGLDSKNGIQEIPDAIQLLKVEIEKLRKHLETVRDEFMEERE